MIELDADPAARTVSFTVPAAAYSEDSVRIAAHIFDRRAGVAAAADKKSIDVELTAKAKTADAAALRRLGGEFLNELLNQEYRALVHRFNGKIAGLVVTQALFSARGGEKPPEQADESAPEFRADVEALMREAREEIARTMPKKIPPQGPPIGPRPKEA